MNLETTILTHLIEDEEYTRKVLPFIKYEYFVDVGEQTLFNKINEHVCKYNRVPTREDLFIELDKDASITEDVFNSVKKLLDVKPEEHDSVWLVDKTNLETFDKKINKKNCEINEDRT